MPRDALWMSKVIAANDLNHFVKTEINAITADP